MNTDWLLGGLILLPMVLAFVCYGVGKKRKNLRDLLAVLAGLAELALALAALFAPGKVLRFGSFGGLGLCLALDGFRKVYAVVIALLWAVTLLFSREYFAHYHNRNRYYFFNLMTLGATMGVFLSGDLYTAFVFFEIMSFTSYVWVLHEQTEGAIRAANTYLAVAVIGGLTALMGLFLLQWQLGTTELSRLYELAKACPNKGVLYAAGGCVLFGFGAKAGMFPLHIWLPKAHPVAPAPASALLSGLLTKSGVWGILVLSCYVFREDPVWGGVILGFGVATMVLGAVLALFSIDLKRTLACSSMSQIGFILVGVGMMGLLGEENALAARGALLHMMNHSLFKLVLFVCAGIVFKNLHALDLNEIRGFGRKKPLLMIAFSMGLLGIGGIPGWSGYVSKALLHESIVEGAAHYGAALQVVEWLFLLSGGLTLAYMAKLFVALFLEKHPTRQGEFDGNKNYVTKRTGIALLVCALSIPALGSTPSLSMDRIADVGTDFLAPGPLAHAVHYFSWENLKGALISLAIGGVVYFLVVRKLLMKNGRYVNRWPAWLDLEELLYRPLLEKWLPGLLGPVAALFGENKLASLLASGLLRFGGWLAGLFGENRLVTPGARVLMKLGEGAAGVFGENKVTAPMEKGVLRVGEGLSLLTGENKVTEPAAKGLFRLGEHLSQATGDNMITGPVGKQVLKGTELLSVGVDALTDKRLEKAADVLSRIQKNSS